MQATTSFSKVQKKVNKYIIKFIKLTECITLDKLVLLYFRQGPEWFVISILVFQKFTALRHFLLQKRNPKTIAQNLTHS